MVIIISYLDMLYVVHAYTLWPFVQIMIAPKKHESFKLRDDTIRIRVIGFNIRLAPNQVDICILRMQALNGRTKNFHMNVVLLDAHIFQGSTLSLHERLRSADIVIGIRKNNLVLELGQIDPTNVVIVYAFPV